jgi:hypothetical protein
MMGRNDKAAANMWGPPFIRRWGTIPAAQYFVQETELGDLVGVDGPVGAAIRQASGELA